MNGLPSRNYTLPQHKEELVTIIRWFGDNCSEKFFASRNPGKWNPNAIEMNLETFITHFQGSEKFAASLRSDPTTKHLFPDNLVILGIMAQPEGQNEIYVSVKVPERLLTDSITQLLSIEPPEA